MIERINSIINIFDVGDLKFFFLVAKKNNHVAKRIVSQGQTAKRKAQRQIS